MISLFKNLFTPKPEPIKKKPLTYITVSQVCKAKLTVSSEEVIILSDMWLKYEGQTKDKIFFKVSCNFHARDSRTEAKNGDIVYWYLDEFETIKYNRV